MKVEVSTVSSFQRKLAIVVPADTVRRELDDAFRTLSHKVRLPGFRPGKAPRRVLEGRFGPSVRADVANKLIQDSYLAAVQEQEITPVSQPELDAASEIKSNTDFEFSLLVDVRPEIELTQYTGVEVAYPKFEVTEEEVTAMTEMRLESQARLVEITDRGVERGDMVMVELVATDGDEEVSREIGTMIRTEADPYYPGIEDALVGLKADDEKDVKITFADDARTESVAGRELDVHLKVINIQANEIPELTDAIAEELGYEGGVDGMRMGIRGELSAGREDHARNQARANLLEKLIELNSFDVPDGMVENALKMLVDELKMQQAYRTGQDPKNINFDANTMQDLQQRALFASKASLILEYVSKTEGIEATDDDLEVKYQELADARGQEVEAIKGWLGSEDAVNELKDRILEEKTLEWLLERAELVDAPVEAPAADAGAAAETDGADTSVLDQGVGAIKKALATGDYDGILDALEAAENAGKARKGALAAIASRRG